MGCHLVRLLVQNKATICCWSCWSCFLVIYVIIVNLFESWQMTFQAWCVLKVGKRDLKRDLFKKVLIKSGSYIFDQIRLFQFSRALCCRGHITMMFKVKKIFACFILRPFCLFFQNFYPALFRTHLNCTQKQKIPKAVYSFILDVVSSRSFESKRYVGHRQANDFLSGRRKKRVMVVLRFLQRFSNELHL